MPLRSKEIRLLQLLAVIVLPLIAATSANAAQMTVSCGGQDNIDVAGGGIDILCTAPITGTITDIDVILDVNNNSGGTTYASDLVITLTHVSSGTSAIVFQGAAPQNPAAIIYSVFDDESPNGVAPGTGNVGDPNGIILGDFQPVDPFNVFDLLPVEGIDNWVLNIEDISSWPNEGHDLVDWSMIVTYTPTPEPGTGILVSLGLIGLVILGGNPERRRERRR